MVAEGAARGSHLRTAAAVCALVFGLLWRVCGRCLSVGSGASVAFPKCGLSVHRRLSSPLGKRAVCSARVLQQAVCWRRTEQRHTPSCALPPFALCLPARRGKAQLFAEHIALLEPEVPLSRRLPPHARRPHVPVLLCGPLLLTSPRHCRQESPGLHQRGSCHENHELSTAGLTEDSRRVHSPRNSASPAPSNNVWGCVLVADLPCPAQPLSCVRCSRRRLHAHSVRVVRASAQPKPWDVAGRRRRRAGALRPWASRACGATRCSSSCASTSPTSAATASTPCSPPSSRRRRRRRDSARTRSASSSRASPRSSSCARPWPAVG